MPGRYFYHRITRELKIVYAYESAEPYVKSDQWWEWHRSEIDNLRGQVTQLQRAVNDILKARGVPPSDEPAAVATAGQQAANDVVQTRAFESVSQAPPPPPEMKARRPYTWERPETEPSPPPAPKPQPRLVSKPVNATVGANASFASVTPPAAILPAKPASPPKPPELENEFLRLKARTIARSPYRASCPKLEDFKTLEEYNEALLTWRIPESPPAPVPPPAPKPEPSSLPKLELPPLPPPSANQILDPIPPEPDEPEPTKPFLDEDYDPWEPAARGAGRNLLMTAESSRQRNLADIVDQRFTRWFREKFPEDEYVQEIPGPGIPPWQKWGRK